MRIQKTPKHILHAFLLVLLVAVNIAVPLMLIKPAKAAGATITITSPTNGQDLTGTHPTVTGTVSPTSANIGILLDDKFVAQATPDGGGNWTTTISAPTNGAHTLKAKILDDELALASEDSPTYYTRSFSFSNEHVTAPPGGPWSATADDPETLGSGASRPEDFTGGNNVAPNPVKPEVYYSHYSANSNRNMVNVADTRTQEVVRSIALPDSLNSNSPGPAIAVSPDGEYLYAEEYNFDGSFHPISITIFQISTQTYQVVNSGVISVSGNIPGSFDMMKLSSDGSLLYFLQDIPGHQTLYALQTADMTALPGFTPISGITHSFDISPDNQHLYMVLNSSRLQDRDALTGGLLRQNSGSLVYGSSTATAISPDGTKVAVTGSDNLGSQFNVQLYDTASLAKTATTAVSTTYLTTALGFNAGSDKLYANNVTDGLRVYNTATTSLTTLSGDLVTDNLALSADGTRMYGGKRYITMSDDSVSAPSRLSPVYNGTAVSPDGTKVYATQTNADKLVVYNKSDQSVVATVAVGRNPRGVAVSSDGSYAYVANYQDDTVSKVRTSDNTVVATFTLPAGSGPVGIDVKSTGDFIFVTDYVSNHVTTVNTSSGSANTNSGLTITRPVAIDGSRAGGMVYVGGGNTVYRLSQNSSPVEVGAQVVTSIPNIRSIHVRPTNTLHPDVVFVAGDDQAACDVSSPACSFITAFDHSGNGTYFTTAGSPDPIEAFDVAKDTLTMYTYGYGNVGAYSIGDISIGGTTPTSYGGAGPVYYPVGFGNIIYSPNVSTPNINVTYVPFTITTSSLPSGQVGQAYSQTLATQGASGAVSFECTSLPAGLSCSTDGQITGTPTAAGTSNVSVSATDSDSQNATQPLSLVIAPAGGGGGGGGTTPTNPTTPTTPATPSEPTPEPETPAPTASSAPVAAPKTPIIATTPSVSGLAAPKAVPLPNRLAALRASLQVTPIWAARSFPYLLFIILLLFVALELYQTRQEVRYSEKLATLTERQRDLARDKQTFFSLIAHYLRTPLTLLKAGVELTSRKLAAAPKAELTGLTSTIAADIEHIITDTEKNDYLDQLKEPTVHDTPAPLWKKPSFWLPLAAVAGVTIAANLVYARLAGYSLGVINLMTQVAVFAVMAQLLYSVLRNYQHQHAERLRAESLHAYEQTLDTARSDVIFTARSLLGKQLQAFEQAVRRDISDAKAKEMIAKGTNRFDKTLSEFDLLAGLDSATVKPTGEPTAVSAIVGAVTNDYAAEAKAKNVTVNTHGAGDLTTNRNAKLLQKALGALVDNAVSYSPEGATVDIRVAHKDGGLTIQVADSGPGIAKERLQDLFKPFAQLEGVETFNREGMGFSLYLNRLVMRYLGGDITAYSKPGAGTTMTITLPD